METAEFFLIDDLAQNIVSLYEFSLFSLFSCFLKFLISDLKEQGLLPKLLAYTIQSLTKNITFELEYFRNVWKFSFD
jgi:hypothetical protein